MDNSAEATETFTQRRKVAKENEYGLFGKIPYFPRPILWYNVGGDDWFRRGRLRVGCKPGRLRSRNPRSKNNKCQH
jgi:hypothetical protein